MKQELLLGDNIELLKNIPDNSIDSLVSDAPYGLSFMGKKWDYDVPSIEFWKEVYRVLKPGAHVLCFGGTRTYHRLVVNMEDAGFEIRDQVQWIYSTGFPKSHNIGKALDKIEGNDREIVGSRIADDITSGNFHAENKGKRKEIEITKGNSDWEGWGSALKPANEPICLARKPMSESTIVENVIKWGTGGINIDGSRIGTETIISRPGMKAGNFQGVDSNSGKQNELITENEGRFPANIIFECICDTEQTHTNLDCPCYDLDNQSGKSKTTPTKESIRKKPILDKETNTKKDIWAEGAIKTGHNHNDSGGASRFFYKIHTNPECPCYDLDNQSGITNQGHWSKTKTKGFGKFGGGDSVYEGVGKKDEIKGGASRFFYTAKVSKAERNLGLDDLEDKVIEGRDPGQDKTDVPYKKRPIPTKNIHPTVKPIKLMSYLCKLITPPGGVILDPYMGSGSTGIAALLNGFDFIGMELDKDYFNIAENRINNYKKYEKFLWKQNTK